LQGKRMKSEVYLPLITSQVRVGDCLLVIY